MAAIDKGTALSEVGLARPTTPWIRNVTWGVALLIVGIGLVGLWWNAFGDWMGAGQGWNTATCLYVGPFMLGLVLSAVGVSLIVRGLLRRAAERKAMALASGVALSEIERPRPIASYSIGTGLLVAALLLLMLMQNYEDSGYMGNVRLVLSEKFANLVWFTLADSLFLIANGNFVWLPLSFGKEKQDEGYNYFVRYRMWPFVASNWWGGSLGQEGS